MRIQTRIEQENKRSQAYQAGLKAGQRASSNTCSPSMDQRRDWAHSWKLYMAGWNVGQREA